ncbi:unnamed protein product [Urochloa decumbens]|uniref:UspA domain-containing protein n=1 Tax=Urochloa decumbens TaxID=240449 RepID=A0ABC8XQS1_9POAL
MLAEPSSVADSPPAPAPAPANAIQPSSPRFLSSVAAENPPYTHRSTGIVVDLSDDSAFAVRWAVQYYLRPVDDVVLLVVSPGSVLYDADWGSIPASVSGEAAAAAGGISSEEEPQKKIQEDYDAFISTKAKGVAQPLSNAQISFDVVSVKDHVCFEAERLGLSAMIVGKCTFRASGKGVKGILGGVNDYCVKHCVCPIVFAPYHDDAVGDGGDATGAIDELQTVLKITCLPRCP